MNEEEVQIDLMTLLHYVLRKWRSILIAMVILAVVANLYSVKKSTAEVKAANETQEIDTEQQIQNVKSDLTEDEIEQVELAYRMYSYNAELYRDNEQYLEHSVVMQLNPNEIPTGMLSYQVRKDTAEEELTNIFAMYENTLLDEDTCTEIAAVFGEEYANTSVRELISVNDTLKTQCQANLMVNSLDSGVLNIQIYAMDQKQCEQITQIMKNRIQTYTEQLQQTFGVFTIKPVSEQYFVSCDNEIGKQKLNAIDAVSSAYSAMQDASSGLSENQLAYYKLLVKSMEEVDADASVEKDSAIMAKQEIQYVNMKYILVGLLAGMFLIVCYHAIVFIMTQTVKDEDEVKTITGYPVFGTVVRIKPTGRKYNLIDQRIDSWFLHGKKKEENDMLLTRISHEVAMMAEQQNMKHLLVAYSENTQHMKELTDTFADKVRELGLDVRCTGSLISDDTDVLRQLESADGVVLVTQLMKTSRDEIRETVELCRRCQSEVLGSVVIGSDLY